MIIQKRAKTQSTLKTFCATPRFYREAIWCPALSLTSSTKVMLISTTLQGLQCKTLLCYMQLTLIQAKTSSTSRLEQLELPSSLTSVWVLQSQPQPLIRKLQVFGTTKQCLLAWWYHRRTFRKNAPFQLVTRVSATKTRVLGWLVLTTQVGKQRRTSEVSLASHETVTWLLGPTMPTENSGHATSTTSATVHSFLMVHTPMFWQRRSRTPLVVGVPPQFNTKKSEHALLSRAGLNLALAIHWPLQHS